VQAQDIWKAAYHQIELQLDRASFDTWLRQAVFLDERDGVYVIGVPNSLTRDMLQDRLYPLIHRVLQDVAGYAIDILFEVHKPKPQYRDDGDAMPLFQLLRQREDHNTESPPLHRMLASPEQPEIPEAELNPRFTFERFVVNQSNRIVYEAASAISEYPATVYNPFLVYGGVGLGKTHLLQSIAQVCAANHLRTIYISSEAFTNDLVNAIRARTTAMFREKYRNVDVLLVDDIQFISGKETTQEEFFHTFNALVNANKQIVLASDRHPDELATLQDRLRSRFRGGLVADIQPPEFETRIAIVQMWAAERHIELPYDVIEMIASHAPNNIRELEGMFNQVTARNRLAGKPVTVHRAQATLERYHRPRERLSVGQIIQVTAESFGLCGDDLVGKRRTGRINRARQVAMYLSRELTDASLPQIGDEFGGRSHTTVLHGCNKIIEEMTYDDTLANQVEKIRDLLK